MPDRDQIDIQGQVNLANGGHLLAGAQYAGADRQQHLLPYLHRRPAPRYPEVEVLEPCANLYDNMHTVHQ